MTQTGSTYGQALYDLARDEELTEVISGELSALCRSFSQEPDFLKLLSSPNLTKAERCAVLDDTLRGKVHPYVLNFLKILTEKGYARSFPDCAEAFRAQYNADHNILPVAAVSALPLSDDQLDRLREKLESLTGKQVALTNRVDASVYGGIRLDYDGKQVDGTIASRLEAVRTLLKNTAL